MTYFTFQPCFSPGGRQDARFHEPDTFTRPFSPQIDVVEGEQEVVLIADLPGVNPEDVDVTVANRVLTLSGKRHASADRATGRSRVSERPSGTFARHFTLPVTVDTTKIAAELKQGVLKVTLPIAAQAQPRKIAVLTN